MRYTPLEGNSFRLVLPSSGLTVLADPWFVGPLHFGGEATAGVYEGRKRRWRGGAAEAREAAASAGLILLTQGLDDHAHLPTLRALPKSLPVVASATAAKAARGVGFENVTALSPGEETAVAGPRGGLVRIAATAGALVGPPWSQRENGYLLREEGEGGVSAYYEPHCDFDRQSLLAAVARAGGRVDVAVSPVTAVSLLGAYELVHGGQAVADLCKVLGKPGALLPLLNADIDEAGALAGLVRRGAPLASFAELFAAAAPSTRLIPLGEAGREIAFEV